MHGAASHTESSYEDHAKLHAKLTINTLVNSSEHPKTESPSEHQAKRKTMPDIQNTFVTLAGGRVNTASDDIETKNEEDRCRG